MSGRVEGLIGAAALPFYIGEKGLWRRNLRIMDEI